MDSDKLYLPVPDLKLTDLLDWQKEDERQHRHLVRRSVNELSVSLDSHHPHKKCFGNSITINDETIALFRIGQEVYATQAKCPHAGGPLYLADLEELVPGQVCLKCPWHKWTFSIDDGCSIKPEGRGLVAKTYPVRVTADGHILIGFDSFGPSAFEM
ncbi:hypothetical protein PoB_007023900 [Plakobranchus ocellatus]|uniref:Rieske domain-containing protein n=1 Tax=Plakobranchus ocellatus TaxID=259542 RepID=A0AAV4DHT0_9GAST|nr:hypothetical protein PoB_007023900 [Plakobranchus ocellatus]